MLKPLQQCPPELLPARGGDGTCTTHNCDLAYQHDSQCAVVSLSGLVIEVLPVWPADPESYEWSEWTAAFGVPE